MKNKIIDCKSISDKIRETLKGMVKMMNKQPCLAIISVGENEASKIYIENKIKACEFIGIKTLIFEFPNETIEEELLELINKLNRNKEVNGIIVQLPLPKHIDKENIIRAINTKKDVDCFHPYNIGMMDKENNIFSPCTALGCIKVLKECNIKIEGKHCVVLGRSNIVGKPVANLMLRENATVTICHSKTKNLKKICKSADIIISAVGQPKFIKNDMVKKDAIILDVGINRDEKGKLCGDVDIDDVIDKISMITPVPRGLGLLTVSILMENCLMAFYQQNRF